MYLATYMSNRTTLISGLEMQSLHKHPSKTFILYKICTQNVINGLCIFGCPPTSHKHHLLSQLFKLTIWLSTHNSQASSSKLFCEINNALQNNEVDIKSIECKANNLLTFSVSPQHANYHGMIANIFHKGLHYNFLD